MGWPSSSGRSYPKNLSTWALTSRIFPSQSHTTMASGENSNSFWYKPLASTRGTLPGSSPLTGPLLDSRRVHLAAGLAARLFRTRRQETCELYPTMIVVESYAADDPV